MLKPFIKKLASPSVLKIYHTVSAAWWAFLAGFPARNLYVIGITGTKGKTTVCHLINEILKASGKRTGMLTTIDLEIDELKQINKLKMTTPLPKGLNSFLKECKDKGCTHIVLETSSHAIDQRRIFGIPYKVAVFLNLTHDHLDYHYTMAEYKEVKMCLWKNNLLDLSVVNKDDPAWADFYKLPANKKLLFGVDNIQFEEGIAAKKIQLYEEGSRFTVITKDGQVPIELNLPGQFNILNSLAAFAVGYGLEIPFEKIKAGIEAVDLVPGRMERVPVKNYNIIIDYAHNADSLKQVLETVKPAVRGRLISVLGACGNRDKTKRPIMGALAGSLADVVIVTNEDPYDEDPEAIIDEVASGVPKGNKSKKLGDNFFKILDRRQGVLKALELARPSDLILITGKGAEEAIVWENGRKEPWSDKRVVLELAEALNKSKA